MKTWPGPCCAKVWFRNYQLFASIVKLCNCAINKPAIFVQMCECAIIKPDLLVQMPVGEWGQRLQAKPVGNCVRISSASTSIHKMLFFKTAAFSRYKPFSRYKISTQFSQVQNTNPTFSRYKMSTHFFPGTKYQPKSSPSKLQQYHPGNSGQLMQAVVDGWNSENIKTIPPLPLKAILLCLLEYILKCAAV